MFVQVIRGRTDDAAAIERRFDAWHDDLMEGAVGFLGSTHGVTDDGEVFLMARFSDEAAARANSDRPEQGAWWEATEHAFDGEAIFAETTDVDLTSGGGSDEAGFVQVIVATIRDRAGYDEVTAAFEAYSSTFRPDFVGGLGLWLDGDQHIELAYFTSEAEARAGEDAEVPDELARAFDKMQTLLIDPTYLDLRSPRTITP